MSTPHDEFTGDQHDADVLTARVIEITAQPVVVGTTPLTPVVSGGVTFMCHQDGAIETMWARCSGCGRSVTGPGHWGAKAQYAALRHVVTAPADRLLARLSRLVSGHCPACGPDGLDRFASREQHVADLWRD